MIETEDGKILAATGRGLASSRASVVAALLEGRRLSDR